MLEPKTLSSVNFWNNENLTAHVQSIVQYINVHNILHVRHKIILFPYMNLEVSARSKA